MLIQERHKAIQDTENKAIKQMMKKNEASCNTLLSISPLRAVLKSFSSCILQKYHKCRVKSLHHSQIRKCVQMQQKHGQSCHFSSDQIVITGWFSHREVIICMDKYIDGCETVAKGENTCSARHKEIKICKVCLYVCCILMNLKMCQYIITECVCVWYSR
jgi:hypothetical protein